MNKNSVIFGAELVVELKLLYEIGGQREELERALEAIKRERQALEQEKGSIGIFDRLFDKTARQQYGEVKKALELAKQKERELKRLERPIKVHDRPMTKADAWFTRFLGLKGRAQKYEEQDRELSQKIKDITSGQYFIGKAQKQKEEAEKWAKEAPEITRQSKQTGRIYQDIAEKIKNIKPQFRTKANLG